MRIVVSCVGSRDPYWAKKDSSQLVFSEWLKQHPGNYASASGVQIGPVLSFLSGLKPPITAADRVWLFSTRAGREVRDPSEEGGKCTRQEIIGRYGIPDSHVVHGVLNPESGGRDADFNPSRYEEVLPRMREAAQSVLSAHGENVEYLVIYSSGTPQMQAAWCVLVNAGLLPARLYRAEGDPVSLAPLFEEQAISQAVSMLRHGTFRAAAAVLSDLSKRAVTPERRGLTRFFGEICEGYDAWNRFAYAHGENLFRQATRGLQRLQEHRSLPSGDEWNELIGRLHSQTAALEECRPDQQASFRTLHLFHSARHKAKVGDYQTALWQYATVVEMLTVEHACLSLKERYGFTVNPAEFRQSLRGAKAAVTELYGGDLMNVPEWLEDHEARRLLRTLNPTAAESLNSEDIRHLRSWRNALVHRQRQVEEHDVYRAEAYVKHAIQQLWDIDPTRDEHAFSYEAIQFVVSLIERVLLRV
jgi:hypothetical protein